MRHFFAVLGAVAVAALAAVVLPFFAKGAGGARTGFGPTELKVLPWVIFFIMTGVFEGMGKKK